MLIERANPARLRGIHDEGVYDFWAGRQRLVFYPQSFATRREAEEKFSELETSGKWNTDEHYIAEGMKRKDVESD